MKNLSICGYNEIISHERNLLMKRIEIKNRNKSYKESYAVTQYLKNIESIDLINKNLKLIDDLKLKLTTAV